KAVMAISQHPSVTGIPISSLSRNNVKPLKKSNPSEPSATAFSDKTDAYKHSTHSTAKMDQVGTAVHIGLLRYASETSENIIASTPSEVSAGLIGANPSEVSEDIITKALALLDGKIVAVIPPDAIVPVRFHEVLATWTPTCNHPGLQDYTPRRICGWTRRGS